MRKQQFKAILEKSTLNDNDNIIGFLVNDDNSPSFKYKKYVTGKTENDGTKNVETWVTL